MVKTYKVIVAGIAMLCMTSCSGCRVTGFEDMTVQQGEDRATDSSVHVEESVGSSIRDDQSIYDLQEDTSVKTMYLTVTQGNAAESTDHTWKSMNSYSTYYYDEHNMDRFGVEGLLQVGDEKGPLSGEFGYEDVTPNAIVTVRGQTSSYNAQKSYKIAIKNGKGSWNDQRIINLNKHQSDGVRFRNKLMYNLIEEIPDMVSLRTQFVHLYVCDKTEGDNDAFQDYGLYTQVEQPNKTFLETHGLDKNGQLYKINYFEFYRYKDTIKLTSDDSYDQKAFEEMLEIKGNDDHSKLIAMLEDVNDYNQPIQEVVDKWFDEGNLLNWLAFQILTGNNDTQSRNTLLYSPLNKSKWYFINWDCDAAFLNEEYRVLNSQQDGSWENGISNYWGNVLFKRIISDTAMQAALKETIESQRKILTQDHIKTLVDQYRKITKGYAYQDPDIGYEPLSSEQFDQVCDYIPKEVEENYQKYLASLEKPMPFFIDTPTTDGKEVDFSWSISYDFDAEDILYTVELADDFSFEHPIMKQENIYLPEAQYKSGLEPGQYFVRVTAKNESGQEQRAFDYYLDQNSQKAYGTKCFYVLSDGTIQEDVNEE